MRFLMLASGLCVFLLSGCDDFGNYSRVTQDFHYSYSLQPGSRLEIDNRNGSIEITGWDRNTIDISGTKYAPTEGRLKDIQIKIQVSGDNASIRTETPHDISTGNSGVQYSIHVPRKTALVHAQTVNGSFSAEDLEGGGEVRSTNGRISLARDVGDYDVTTTNGGVELNGLTGSQRAGTTNGSIQGRLEAGALYANSTNGGIDFTILKPSENMPIRLRTTNGGITLEMHEFHGNAIDAQTTHGGVTLRLPESSNARIVAHTSLATISSDLNFSSTISSSRRDLEAVLGSGGPPVSLQTTTGGIHIEGY